MNLIETYVITDEDRVTLSNASSLAFMSVKYGTPAVYEIQFSFKKNMISCFVGMQHIASSRAFMLCEGEDCLNSELYRTLTGFRSKLAEEGYNLVSISCLASLIVLEKSPNTRLGVKSTEYQLFEE